MGLVLCPIRIPACLLPLLSYFLLSHSHPPFSCYIFYTHCLLLSTATRSVLVGADVQKNHLQKMKIVETVGC